MSGLQVSEGGSFFLSPDHSVIPVSALLFHSIPSALQVSDGRSFQVKARFDTEVELTYYRHGGILNYMVRQML